MKDNVLVDFRAVLRDATRPHHDRVDSLFSTLDLTSPAGYGTFLRAQEGGFRVLAGVAGAAPSTPLLATLHARLADDARSFGTGLVVARLGRAAPPCPALAVEYVLHGSRLGTNVLRKRWAKSTDPQVLSANSYFSAPWDASAWTGVCRDLAAVPPDSHHARDIIRATAWIFDMFEGMFLAARAPDLSAAPRT